MVARQYLVWGGLLVTLAACYWASTLEQDTPLESASSTSMPGRRIQMRLPEHTNNTVVVPLTSHRNNDQLILRSADVAPPLDLFAPLAVAVGSEAQIAANQAPTAPNNPYSYAGKISEGDIWTVFLTDGSNNFAAKAGDELQGGWWVKRIENDTVVLLYQPMKHEVKLETGATL